MKIDHVTTTEQHPWQTSQLTESTAPASANLELSGQRFQTVRGFGMCFNELEAVAFGRLPAAKQAEVMRALFAEDGCRFNFCRLPIGANDYALDWYSFDEHDGDYAMEHFSVARDEQCLIPLVKQALDVRKDVEFFASPWSPPTWMKTHRVCNHGTMRWEPQVLRAYALYFEKFVRAYQQRGVNVTQIHVQNEPMSDQKFPSCVWTGDQMREFIGEYLGPHFEKNLVPAEIWLGTINGPEGDHRWPWTRYDQFANNVLSDPKAAKYTKGVAYQWAGKYALQQTALAYPHVPIIQSENECGDGQNTWRYAQYVWELMQHYFTNATTAYVYWNAILDQGGVSTWGWRQNSMITVDPKTSQPTYRHEFYVMKHLAHFVKPGAVRLGLRGPWTSNALAFENTDKSIVLALANPFADARQLSFAAGSQRVEVMLEPASINTIFMRP